jgi:PAS domain S-box-containing protein
MNYDNIELSLPDWIVNSKTFSILITDLKGDYLYVNPGFAERFAWMNTNFIGESFASTVHPEDVEKCNEVSYECVMNPGRIIPVRIRKPQNPEGIYKWTDWEFSTFHNAKGEVIGILCLGYDITNLKIFAAEALITKFKLKNIAQIQSHEFRAPVANILGIISLMQNESDKTAIFEYLALLKDSAEKLDEMIYKVVGLTKDEL